MTTGGPHSTLELSVDSSGRLNTSARLVSQASKLILGTTVMSWVAIPFFTPASEWVFNGLAVFVFMLLYLASWRLAERGRPVLGAHLFLWGTWLGQAGVVLTTSGLTHQALVSGVNLVLAAGFMLGRKAAAVAGLMSAFSLALFELLWAVELLPPVMVQANEPMSMMALFSTVAGTVGLTYIGIHNMTEAIMVAEDNADRAEEARASLQLAREAEALRATRAERLGTMARSLVSLREPDAIMQEAVISLRDALDASVVMAVGRAGRMLSSAGLGDTDPPQEVLGNDLHRIAEHSGTMELDEEILDRLALELGIETMSGGMVARGPHTSIALVVLFGDEAFVPEQMSWSIQIAANLMDAAILRTESEHRVVQAQKMDALSRLSGGIAHDFNNLLTTILGGAEILEHTAPSDDPVQARLRNIRTAGERAAALTSKLMTFTRGLPRRRRIVDFSVVVSDLIPVLRRTVEENISIEFHEPGDGLWVDADPIDLERIVLNLVANARDAVGDSGRIDIGLDIREVDDPEAQAMAVLWVQDNGEGMDMGTRSRVFEPFFTTRRGKGATGLGLSIVYGVVQAMGGDVFIDSTRSTGTCVEVHMPRHSSIDAVDTGSVAAVTPANGAIVLVVEDDPDVRETVCGLLELGGYTAVSVASAGEALDVLKQDDVVNLVLSDVVMPEMGGLELGIAMRDAGFTTPLALISGYAPSQVDTDDQAPEFPRITKPFSMNELLAFVSEQIVS